MKHTHLVLIVLFILLIGFFSSTTITGSSVAALERPGTTERALLDSLSNPAQQDWRAYSYTTSGYGIHKRNYGLFGPVNSEYLTKVSKRSYGEAPAGFDFDFNKDGIVDTKDAQTFRIIYARARSNTLLATSYSKIERLFHYAITPPPEGLFSLYYSRNRCTELGRTTCQQGRICTCVSGPKDVGQAYPHWECVQPPRDQTCVQKGKNAILRERVISTHSRTT